MSKCPDCDGETKPYHPETGAFVSWHSVRPGQLFRIPDLHGNYAQCGNGGIEVNEMLDDGKAQCVVCENVWDFSSTLISVVEVVS